MTEPQPWQPPAQQGNVWVPGSGGPGYAELALTPGRGPLGTPRDTGACMGLFVITFGLYSLYWYFQVHEEMKRHTGRGLGGTIALVISVVAGIAMPYLTSNEVGSLYESHGRPKPVSGLTGLWNFPGIFLLVGPIVWFVKTNGALNTYWRNLGAA